MHQNYSKCKCLSEVLNIVQVVIFFCFMFCPLYEKIQKKCIQYTSELIVSVPFQRLCWLVKNICSFFYFIIQFVFLKLTLQPQPRSELNVVFIPVWELSVSYHFDHYLPAQKCRQVLQEFTIQCQQTFLPAFTG